MGESSYLGSHVTPLVFVEVTPLVMNSKDAPWLSVPFVKQHLCSQGVMAVKQWTALDDEACDSRHGEVAGGNLLVNGSDFLYLPTLNPMTSQPFPCRIVGYGFPTEKLLRQVIVSHSTLIRILQSDCLHKSPSRAIEVEDSAYGERPTPPVEQVLRNELYCNHDDATKQALKLRISMLLSKPIVIGTTNDAVENFKRSRRRSIAIQGQIDSYTGRHSPVVSRAPVKKQVDGSLTLHSPYHGAGKTLLVRSIAEELNCQVHIVESAPLIAKYGINADSALESLVHSILISASVRNKRICIILDHLQTFGSPPTKGPDSLLPILVSMTSYLSTLTRSLQQKGEVPFPNKNLLYNLDGSNGKVFRVHACLVGIVTCPDGNRKKGPSQVLNMLHGSRYRLPDLTSQGRIQALSKSLNGMPLPEAVQRIIPNLVASQIQLRGRDFRRIAQSLQSVIQSKGEITVDDFVNSLSSTQQKKPVQYEIVINVEDNNTIGGDLFSSVGGNTEAKLALQDALAMDSTKRLLLQKFGMSPPTGVLLYGPPGTGKTLLARAVAKLLSSRTTGLGGAFFSLQASEIVRSEVGNSEKEIVSAFEVAMANSPSVIFIDEFQALFTERSGSGGQLASTLLHCMDDVNRWEGSDKVAGNEPRRVVVMGATNTPWMIDTAFLRAGRFDKIVHVGLPDQRERNSILQVLIKRMRWNSKERQVDKICDKLSQQTDGFSGADLAALCRAAAVRCLREQGEDGVVYESHFLEALDVDVIATSSDELVGRLSAWKP